MIALALAIVVLSSATAGAADKTDVITLDNGDRITGEIVTLNRGQLQLKTDNAGTIYIEWDKIVSVESTRQFDVATSDGRRFLGSLVPAGGRSVMVAGIDGVVSLSTAEVTGISPIGASFWKKLDGSVDAGFTYTRSSGVAQTTLNSDTVFRRPAFEFHLTGTGTLTYRSDDPENSPSNQASVVFSYVRFAGRRWLFGGSGRAETNESLGLVLRSAVAGLLGMRLVNTNHAQFLVGGGLDVNNEQGVDTGATQNVEGVLSLQTSYYSYDSPKTTLDLSLQYYPSLSNWGRQRLQFNTNIKRDLFKDFYVGFNAFDTFDSAPPNPDAAHNDVGVVASMGWSFGR